MAKRATCSWFKGYLLVSASAALLSATAGAIALGFIMLATELYGGAGWDAWMDLGLVPFFFVAALPVAGAASIGPTTLAYAVTRQLARSYDLTTARRVAFGVGYGIVTNVLAWLLLRSSLPWDSAWTVFPAPEIQASAFLIAVTIRSRWLGVP